MPAAAQRRDSSSARPVEQREPVVVDDRIDRPVLEDRRLHRQLAHGESDGGREPLLLHLEQLLHGAALAGDLAEVAGMFGVVQVQQVDPVDARAPVRLSSSDCRARSASNRRVSISRSSLVETAKPSGRPPRSRIGGADPLFAAAHAVVARGVEPVRRPLEDPLERRPGARLVDTVAIGPRHVGERRGAKARSPSSRSPVRPISRCSILQASPPASGETFHAGGCRPDACPAAQSLPQSPAMDRIDAHHHFWHPARGDYDWMPADDPVLSRPVPPGRPRARPGRRRHLAHRPGPGGADARRDRVPARDRRCDGPCRGGRRLDRLRGSAQAPAPAAHRQAPQAARHKADDPGPAGRRLDAVAQRPLGVPGRGRGGTGVRRAGLCAPHRLRS